MANNLDVKLRIDTAVEGLAAVEQLAAGLKSLLDVSSKKIADPMVNITGGAEDAARAAQSLGKELKEVGQAKVGDPVKPLRDGAEQAGKSVQTLAGQVKSLGTAGGSLGGMEASAHGLAKGMSGAASEARTLAGGLTNIGQSGRGLQNVADDAKKAGDNLGYLEKMAKNGLAALAGYLSFRGLSSLFSSFSRLSSEYTDLASRLENVTANTDEAELAMRRIKETADRTYASIGSTADIFLENAIAFRDLGYSASQQLDFMSAMTDALVVSGAKGQRAEMVIRALSRALMEGTLSGHNWNTVLQSGGRVVKALADGLGVTIDELRRMGTDKELSAANVFQALMSQMDVLKRESEAMPATIADAFVRLSNQIFATVGELDQVNGASKKVVENIDKITSILIDNQALIGEMLGGLSASMAWLVERGIEGIKILQKVSLALIGLADTAIVGGQAISLIFEKIKNPVGGPSFDDILKDYKQAVKTIEETVQAEHKAINEQAKASAAKVAEVAAELGKAISGGMGVVALDENFRAQLSRMEQAIADFGGRLSGMQILDISKTITGHDKAQEDFQTLMRSLIAEATAARDAVQAQMANMTPGTDQYRAAEAAFKDYTNKVIDYNNQMILAKIAMDVEYAAKLETAWAEQERGEQLSADEKERIYSEFVAQKWKMEIESVERVKQAKIDEVAAVINACNEEIAALQQVVDKATEAGGAILTAMGLRKTMLEMERDASKTALDTMTAELEDWRKSQQKAFQELTARIKTGGGVGAAKKPKAKSGGGGKSAAVREAERESKALEAETKRRAEAERKIQEEALRAALQRGEIDIREFMAKKTALAQEAADNEVALARAALDRIKADRKASQSDIMKAETDLMIAENNAPKQYENAYKEAFNIVAQEHAALQAKLQSQITYTNSQVEAGFLSQAQGQRQIKEQVEQTLPILESMVEQYAAMVEEAEKLGLVIPGITEKLLEMKSVNLQNKQVMTQTANEINAVFEGAFSSALSNVADQWHDLIGLARTFIKTILDGIAQIMAKNLASSLATSLGMGGGGGGLGGLLSGIFGFAGGGAVDGPGTSTSDSILARLSRGEYVINARAVRLLGRRFLDAINNVKNPGVFMQPHIAKFAAGGAVSPTMASIGGGNPASSLAANIGFTVENNWDKDGFITSITRDRRFRRELIRAAGEEKKAFRNIIS